MGRRKQKPHAPEISIEVEPEEIPFRGNVLASGNEIEDRLAEEEVRDRLYKGDVWAWCSVRVHASLGGFTGSSSWLGCCNYHSEADFRQPGGYYDDLKQEAIEDLKEKIEAEKIARMGT